MSRGPWLVPSIYSPIAWCGVSRSRRVRRVFRWLFTNHYRKGFWNPVVNSWLKDRGFDRRKYIRTINFHAIGSAACLVGMAASLWGAWGFAAIARSLPVGSDSSEQNVMGCYRGMVGFAVFDLVFNMPGIVLARYLYLLTVRRPAIQRGRSGVGSKTAASGACS